MTAPQTHHCHKYESIVGKMIAQKAGLPPRHILAAVSPETPFFHLQHGGKDICFLSSTTKEHTAVKASERMMRLITQHTYILQLRDAFCIQQRVPIGFTFKKKSIILTYLGTWKMWQHGAQMRLAAWCAEERCSGVTCRGSNLCFEKLDDFGQALQPLCASVSSTLNWEC